VVNTIRQRSLVLIGAVAMLAAAGCGSDDGSTQTSSTKPRTVQFGGPDSGRPFNPNANPKP
jgi:hypothetical protein